MKLKILLTDADIRRALENYIFDVFQVAPKAADLKIEVELKYSTDFWDVCENLRLEVEISK